MATEKLLHTFSSLIILFLLYCFETSVAITNCTPSACGIITNISYPFRLKDDPKGCGLGRFELTCENDVVLLSLNSKKYTVKAINYDNSTMRLADASINNHTCSFPNSSSYPHGFINTIGYYIRNVVPVGDSYELNVPINLMSCPYPLKKSSLFTQNITHCASSYSNSPHPKPRYTYIKLGHVKPLDVPETCAIDIIVITSWKFKNLNNVSLSEIHHSLLYGFKLRFSIDEPRSWTAWARVRTFLFYVFLPTLLVVVGLTCAVVSPPVMTILGFAAVLLLLVSVYRHFYYNYFSYYKPYFQVNDFTPHKVYYSSSQVDYIAILILAPRFIIFPAVLWFLIRKFRRRHLSVYDTIESFLQSDNKLVPIRYSYSDIKKMTRGFKDKLGEGGYGSVYKGKLRSGRDVAIKLLKKSKGNDQEFINEISTIGRVHHVNIVNLVGYCAQGSKRALIFDFMQNGSLEKYLFDREKKMSLNLDTKFEIAIGVARGIEYLHRGCDVQILHFDIKPHNVLLDDNFVPKISDFGLAKFYSIDKNTVTMTAARGTIGYVAPELISRSIGAVSYKADVYSFGMLLMEMVSLNKDLIKNNGDSNMYFPYWIYDCFKQGKDIEIQNNGNDDDCTRRLVRKMTIVALWCIQMSPNNRPSMNKVLEMLEGNVERLQLPSYPSESTQTVVNADQNWSTYSTDSVSLLSHEDVSTPLQITIPQ